MCVGGVNICFFFPFTERVVYLSYIWLAWTSLKVQAGLKHAIVIFLLNAGTVGVRQHMQQALVFCACN